MNVALFAVGCVTIVVGIVLLLSRHRLMEWNRRGLHWQGLLDWSEMFPRFEPFETIGVIGVGLLLIGVGLYFVVNAFRW